MKLEVTLRYCDKNGVPTHTEDVPLEEHAAV